jgi:hypothetical protein
MKTWLLIFLKYNRFESYNIKKPGVKIDYKIGFFILKPFEN